MFIVHRHGHLDTDLEISVAGLTAGDVAGALVAQSRANAQEPHIHGAPLRCTLRVDGTVIDPRQHFDQAGVSNGAVVEVVRPSRLPTPRRPGDPSPWVLTTTNGLWAGRRQRLRSGTTLLGSAAGPCAVVLADPTVSARHLRLDVRGEQVAVEDLGSRNGTWLGGRCLAERTEVARDASFVTGATRLELRYDPPGAERAPLRSSALSGPRPFHRPPRRSANLQQEPVPLPDAPGPAPSALPIGVTAVVLPLLLGLCLMWLLHSILWGLLALLGPLVLVGGAWEQRRRGRRGERRVAARFRHDLEALSSALAAAAHDQRVHLEGVAPDLGALCSWVATRSPRMWECRPGHPDFLRLRLGIGDVSWDPPVDPARGTLAPAVVDLLRAHDTITDAPMLLSFDRGETIGLVGDDDAVHAVARSLALQAAIRHGPADLCVVVLSDAERASRWRWALRLPHTRTGTGGRTLVAGGAAAEALATELCAHGDRARPTVAASPALFVIVDAPRSLGRRRSAVRALLAEPTAAAVVLGRAGDRLPSTCSATVMIDSDGRATLDQVGETRAVSLVCMGADEATAAEAARQLAAWEDPEAAGGTAGLPGEVALASLLPFDITDPGEVMAAWNRRDTGLTTPLGVAPDGPFVVDLVADGPHGLVAGTTGSGKSELLRTLVLGLASTHSPADVELVLIDFKGGSTFRPLRALPHVVGTVTDLDGALARRAVLALEGELRRRELILQQAGAQDLVTYRALRTAPASLPRLVVVIDEFATLAADHPDVLDGFVSVAQRGRSLGLHLVLATQRPTGSVNDHLRANTNLRIALRVQDAADSRDVIDVPDAAALRRNQPGRALSRLGPGEIEPIQVATTGSNAGSVRRGVDLHPLLVPLDAPGTAAAAPHGSDGTDGADRAAGTAGADDTAGTAGGSQPGSGPLARVVGAIVEAHERSGGGPTAPLWPEPLPEQLALEELWEHDGGEARRPGRHQNRRLGHRSEIPTVACTNTQAPFAVADDPANQRRAPIAWHRDEGHLLVLGAPAAGAAKALGAVCLALTRSHGPSDLHLHVLHQDSTLAPLARLAHTGSVIGPAEAERRRRLLRYLSDELDDRRRAPSGVRPRIVLVVDGVGALLAADDDPFESTRSTIERFLSDGPGAGIHLALSAERPGALPGAWMSLIRQRLVLSLAEPADLALVGVARDVPLPPVPGRGWWAGAGLVVQVGDPSAALAELAARHPGPVPRPGAAPRRIGVLPERVLPCELAHAPPGSPVAEGAGLALPAGIADSDLRPAPLRLHPGDHALVVGPPRSGRSSLLAGLAEVACSQQRDLAVMVLTAGRAAEPSWPQACIALDRRCWPEQLAELAASPQPVLALIDDGHRLAGDDDLTRLLQEAPPHLHLVVSVANAALRAGFGHWTRRLTDSRTGLLLCPDVDLDGELFGVRLPRRPPAAPSVGRGWLVADGSLTYLQGVGWRDMKHTDII